MATVQMTAISVDTMIHAKNPPQDHMLPLSMKYRAEQRNEPRTINFSRKAAGFISERIRYQTPQSRGFATFPPKLLQERGLLLFSSGGGGRVGRVGVCVFVGIVYDPHALIRMLMSMPST